jgi:ribosome-associated protein
VIANTANTRLQRSLQDACQIAKLCEEYRGKDTVVLDLTNVTPIVDFFVITTGTSTRQMHALSDEVRVQMKVRGHKAPATEGYEQSSWILQDWGDIVLHTFLPDAREMYDLEGLWADGKRVDWKAVIDRVK